MPDLAYGPINGDADLSGVARLIHAAFASPLDQAETWLRTAGLEHVRVVREGSSRPLGCLLRVPMGQFFGGRSVRMLGIAGVAVAPEARGRGVALSLMRNAMLEAAGEGWPLAGLYASTQSLYRQVGFEQAGHRFRVRLRPSAIGIIERSLTMRELMADDDPAVEANYRTFASAFNGPLDRGAYVWSRIRERRGEKFEGFGVFEGDRLVGYVYLSQRRKPETGRHDLALSDIAFTTPAAGRRLLTFLGDFATMADEIEFFGGPVHPLLTLLPLQQYQVERVEYWMLRVLNVAGAMAARGVAPFTNARWAVGIRDELIPSNAGGWTILTRDGAASAMRGSANDASAPTVASMDIRGFASVYAGLYSPLEASHAGLIDGTDAALRPGLAVFSGGTPWMSDMF